MPKAKPKIIVVLGPTATGKSDLAVALARKFSGEIVSADSRQVYRGLDIGTGKITKSEMRGVPHYLLDITDPKKQFSADLYVRKARSAIDSIVSHGRIPIICGGTGFYISALLGETSLSSVPPNPTLRKKLAKKSASELFLMLKKLDPRRAKTIDKQNPRRLIRAIEIASYAEETLNGRGTDAEKEYRPQFKTLKIGLTIPKDQLQKRIDQRLRSRLKNGMLEEATRLHRTGLSWKRMDELGLEYRYMARFLQNKISREEMEKKIKTESWRYAKRQTTWFKRDKEIKWFHSRDTKKIYNLTQRFLQ